MAKYQVISKLDGGVLIEGDDYTQPTRKRVEFTPDEQNQFPGSGGMDDNNLTETQNICCVFKVNR